MTPLIEELRPVPDPLDTASRFVGQPYVLFLDSARDPDRLGRYSFLAADPALLLRGNGSRTELVDLREGSATHVAGNALEAARSVLAPHRVRQMDTLPPFQGGLAGYVAYDFGAVLERLPTPRYDDLAIPDAMLALYDWVIAWDHRDERAWLVSTGAPATGADKESRAAERTAWVRQVLTGRRAPSRHAVSPEQRSQRRAPTPRAPMAPSFPVTGERAELVGLRSSFTHEAYLDAVRRVRDYILAGDIFQANLSQRLEAPLRTKPWTLYTRLRAINPAPFAAYLDFHEVIIASASPERFLSLTPDGIVETRPIKGTRPRGTGPEHDAFLSRALADSEKDRAENLMIVDLLRNDLSRVADPRSVRVAELFALEHYSTVHHLVSTVTGQLATGRDALDLLAAAFPGGSITGAPKVRAMEIIAELEPSRRGVYCGTIGYLSFTGALDTSIVIRTYVALGEHVYFSVGGGIVADSDPEQEWRETLDKARALIEGLVE
ncbi:MAG TPA: aminodeoxychorismate synthase component I [Gemmatimonadaceae bacterium]|nr:aminodeoxychorismate synthase component I [Gemmatimonadaceae bacterium]